MESTTINHTSPEEGHRVHWPKPRELSSQQDEDKGPNNLSNNNTIPSSRKLRKKLSDRYGPDVILCWRRLEKLNKKLARRSNHLTFLFKCRNLRLIPPGLHINAPVSSRRAHKITEKAGHALVRERIQHNRWMKHQLQAEINNEKMALRDIISSEPDYDIIMDYLHQALLQELRLVKNRQRKKLEKITDRVVVPESDRPQPIQAVINVSTHQLGATEREVLNKGLNFATSSNHVPLLDIIAPIEEMTFDLPSALADEFRWKIRLILEKAKPPTPNITKEEKTAIRTLRQNNNIIILPADKGNATVVMDKHDYNQRMTSLLSDGSYLKIKKGPHRFHGKKTGTTPRR